MSPAALADPVARLATLSSTADIPLKTTVIVSHGASRRVTRGSGPHTEKHLDRALTGNSIKAIVKTGGCISIILAPYFLRNVSEPDGTHEKDADLAFIVRYYEQVAEQIAEMGIVDDPWKHLSFGSDFGGGISSVPIGMKSGADLPELTRAMLNAGWSAERIKDVYSENFLRVWEKARERKTT